MSVRDLLLTRRGVACVAVGEGSPAEKCVRAVALEFAEIGFAISHRLGARLSTCSENELLAFRDRALAALVRHLGGDQKHEPLFRRFPQDVPDDTSQLWWKKVLVHFLQAEGQPCLLCRRTGTTHVLNPCRHIVCDHCFDGATYSACPVCERHVDRSSPFFQASPERGRPLERVIFKLLDLADSEENEAKSLFISLCERKQALSPVDRDALQIILREYKSHVLAWVPSAIPVRENVAIVFGTLFQECDPDDVLPQARRHMTTATDVLRFLAVLSGTDGSLLRETVFKTVESFIEHAPSFATPVLLTLRSHLPLRLSKARVRVYWPKGRIAKGVSSSDERATLPLSAIEPAIGAIESELLRRFGEKPAFTDCVIDEALRAVTVPFNERTASAAAVCLPRGSRVAMPLEKTTRLFLHWCQPATGGRRTDLDLSVALYDARWHYLGVCSYYQLKLTGKDGHLVAQSAGDLQDAPWPDGATEFVDLHSDQAIAMGARYVVMVVNSYIGMPFSRLERGFAGLMLRDDTGGEHFDPRTVELKFALDGENGVFLPLVLDLNQGLLHWLDVQSKGQFEMNNVETSNAAITKICPELMTYFESGARPSMYDLAMLHAAARCQRVMVRGAEARIVVRRPGEDGEAFLRRLLSGESASSWSQSLSADGPPMLAVLYRGDVDLPRDSCVYALFRERLTLSIAASDLLS